MEFRTDQEIEYQMMNTKMNIFTRQIRDKIHDTSGIYQYWKGQNVKISANGERSGENGKISSSQF